MKEALSAHVDDLHLRVGSAWAHIRIAATRMKETPVTVHCAGRDAKVDHLDVQVVHVNFCFGNIQWQLHMRKSPDTLSASVARTFTQLWTRDPRCVSKGVTGIHCQGQHRALKRPRSGPYAR